MVMNLALGTFDGNCISSAQERSTSLWKNFWLRLLSLICRARGTYGQSHAKIKAAQNIRSWPYLCCCCITFGYLAISTILPPHFSILSRYQEANGASVFLSWLKCRYCTLPRTIGSWLLRLTGACQKIFDRHPEYSKKRTFITAPEHCHFSQNLLYVSFSYAEGSLSQSVLQRK